MVKILVKEWVWWIYIVGGTIYVMMGVRHVAHQNHLFRDRILFQTNVNDNYRLIQVLKEFCLPQCDACCERLNHSCVGRGVTGGKGPPDELRPCLTVGHLIQFAQRSTDFIGGQARSLGNFGVGLPFTHALQDGSFRVG